MLLDYEATCAAGLGLINLRQALKDRNSGLCSNDIEGSHLSTRVGSIQALNDYRWGESEKEWQSRNNALIDLALRQGSISNSVASLKKNIDCARIGVVMGSSTSSIDRAELAYRYLEEGDQLSIEFQQERVLNPHAPGLYVAQLLGLTGPNLTINTACSSSAKVFATASRWLLSGLVDAVLVGGADTLCLSVLHGFHSLQLVSEDMCKPFDQYRDGINLGEGAGFAILMREADAPTHCGVKLSGYGESSDAHHMSHPHPEGTGALQAIEQALHKAHLRADDIDYINLHGTASKANDHVEGNLIGKLFPKTLASSTKAWMGHTLGAAGIIESVIALDALKTNLIPGTLNLSEVDGEIDLNILIDNHEASVEHVMSNSFGFGGNNACLIFSRVVS